MICEKSRERGVRVWSEISVKIGDEDRKEEEDRVRTSHCCRWSSAISLRSSSAVFSTVALAISCTNKFGFLLLREVLALLHGGFIVRDADKTR